MKKYNSNLDTTSVNAILRRLNGDDNFKIDFTEFSIQMSPVIAGYLPEACLTPEVDLNIPTDPLSDDILIQSKFKGLLKHDGIPFRLE